MNRMWIAAPLCFATAALAGPEQDAVSAAMAELGKAKTALMQEYASRGKAFPATPQWTYHASAAGVSDVSYNSKNPTSASLVATMTGTKNPAIDNRHLAFFAAAQPDGSMVWTCGTARSALRTAPSEETTMYPYLPAECQH